ncbi:MAG: ParA family protein [Gammaproteobacteria bacterium]|nr:ParA family protein [Gammaproteobacteria bacterium]
MKVVAVASQKGGSGKTTVAIHLATWFAQVEEKNVVLIDLDPQASACAWSDYRHTKDPVVLATHANRLQSELHRIAEHQGDIVILDTAPHSDSIALEAMRSAHLVLIPTRPSFLDIKAVVNTLTLAQMARTEVVAVLNQCPPRGQDANEAEKAISALDVEVSVARLTQRTIFGRALLNGQTAIEAEPKSKAAHELTALGRYITQKLSSPGEDP